MIIDKEIKRYVVGGVVENIRKDRRGLKLDNGNWYGAWSATTLKDIEVGQTVHITYDVDKTGKFNNIKSISTATATATEKDKDTEGTSIETGAFSTTTTKKSYSRGTFPIPPLDGQRSIIRQNALTHAINLLEYSSKVLPISKLSINESANVETIAQEVIKIARIFEAYSSGDIELEKVKEFLKKNTVSTDTESEVEVLPELKETAPF